MSDKERGGSEIEADGFMMRDVTKRGREGRLSNEALKAVVRCTLRAVEHTNAAEEGTL